LTTAYNDWDEPVVAEGVYAPQEDSQLLIDVMDKTGLARGRRVADLCTGSGVIAIAAAQQGASEVTAFDICPRAAHFARQQVSKAGADVGVHLGSWARAAEFGPYDLVVCNPPYVPHDPSVDEPDVPPHIGPAHGSCTPMLPSLIPPMPSASRASSAVCCSGSIRHPARSR